VNELLRPKFGAVAGILAQSPAVAGSFGRWPGFILMMTAMTVVLVVSLTTIAVIGRGTSHLLGIF
jgi:hypothetical protein